jgi:hypothetical protein
MGSRAAFGGGHHGGDVPVTAARTTPRPTHDAPNTVSGLVRKRAEIAGHIEVAQIGLRRMIVDLDHIDAAIRMLVPEAAVTGSVRFPARRQWPLPTQSDGVDAPRRHLSARVEVFEQPLKGGVHGTG